VLVKRQSTLFVWSLVFAIAACTGGQSAMKAAAVRPQGEGSVEIRVEGVSSGRGTVYGSIYLAPEGFPGDKSLAYTYDAIPANEANDGSLLLKFSSIPAGWFVVAILHDKDEDEELSMNSFGVPKEKYGFSQNPESIFGPPDFDDAAIFLESGETKQIVIAIN
jgi:uncharacterized protein (DUF2141 family)